MINSRVRLFSWVDVEESLLRAQEELKWPTGLIEATSFVDGLVLRAVRTEIPNLLTWLKEIFDPRLIQEPLGILLESVGDTQRILPITFEEAPQSADVIPFAPTFARPRIMRSSNGRRVAAPTAIPDDLPPIMVFHSFKGGVGRTLHSLAVSHSISKKKGDRVLLIDGDLEAPGLTWMIEKRFPDAAVSYADLLALAYEDQSEEMHDTVDLVAHKLRDQRIEGTYVMPAFRSRGRWGAPEITPQHLTHLSTDPFRLTTLLSRLGKALNTSAVVVDLRAGLSELSASLLFDPRVYRVIVSTTTGQSLDGTELLLEIMAQHAPSITEDHPIPAILLTMVPPELAKSGMISEIVSRLIACAGELVKSSSVDLDMPVVSSPFESTLLSMSLDWTDVLARIERSGLMDVVSPLVLSLPARVDGQSDPQDARAFQKARTELASVARKLEYAEQGEGDDFLPTRGLENLAMDYEGSPPVVLIVGAKGSGKTYTFFQMIQNQDWKSFVDRSLRSADQISEAHLFSAEAFDGLFYPILAPKNLNPTSNAVKLIRQAEGEIASHLDVATPLSIEDTRDSILSLLKAGGKHEGEWREFWLDLFAWRVGLKPREAGVGREFIKWAAAQDRHLVLLIDGIEDLFQNIVADEQQQVALRALLQDVPNWLNQQLPTSLGLIIFIRRDLVSAAVKQNVGQLLNLYQPYALRWNPTEALRLVAWVAHQASIIDVATTIDTATEEDLSEILVPLWGRKLGISRSREGRSASWVIAALSDFNGLIQARDLVRFLRISADLSRTDQRWVDRVLVPVAVRNAIFDCGVEKINEIEQENPLLAPIFAKLRSLPESERTLPLPSTFSRISQDELAVLISNGIFAIEKDGIYMPEIFRLGLQFRLPKGARPKVLSLSHRKGSDT